MATLVARNPNHTTAPAAIGNREQFDVEMQRAMAIAKATDCIPTSYRNNPGAVLLAQQWAETNSVSTLEAIQHVTFIKGKPNVSAEMREALARRAGYDTRTVAVSDTAATVEVSKDGDVLGTYEALIEDIPADLKRKDVWKSYPANMLYATALRQALRFYAKGTSLLALAPDPDEIGPDTDAIEVLEQAAEPKAEEPAPAPEPEPEPEAEDAVVFLDPEEVKASIKAAGLTQAQALQAAQAINGDIVNVTMLADHPDILASVLQEAE